MRDVNVRTDISHGLVPHAATVVRRNERRASVRFFFSWCVAVLVFIFLQTQYYAGRSSSIAPVQAQGPIPPPSSSSQLGSLLRKRPAQDVGSSCNCNRSASSLSRLRPSDQHWSHATNNVQMLDRALLSPSITAIEADILMGHIEGRIEAGGKSSLPIPIMSHPPSRTSDLSLYSFLNAVANITTPADKQQEPTLLKHVKLDFKEMRGMEPAFQLLGDLGYINPNGKTVVLNADLFAGPGRRFQPPRINADEFMTKAMKLIRLLMEKNYQNKTGDERLQFAFSIGHSVDSRSLLGYTVDDMVEVLDLVERYTKTDDAGEDDAYLFIYCPNAHLLVKDFEAVDFLLDELPETAQLLVWTGHGEIPISQDKEEQTKAHFVKQRTISRVAFDIRVTESLVSGFVCDRFNSIFGLLVGAFRTVQKALAE